MSDFPKPLFSIFWKDFKIFEFWIQTWKNRNLRYFPLRLRVSKCQNKWLFWHMVTIYLFTSCTLILILICIHNLISVAPLTCSIRFSGTEMLLVLFFLMISSTALISSMQFHQDTFWQELITSLYMIRYKRVTATSAGHFCLAKLPFSFSHIIGTNYLFC